MIRWSYKFPGFDYINFNVAVPIAPSTKDDAMHLKCLVAFMLFMRPLMHVSDPISSFRQACYK